jgi:UDP-N-acetylmuramyl pentapeptide synthase
MAGKLHENIAEHLKSSQLDLLISVGTLAVKYGAQQHYDSVEQLNDSDIMEILPADSVILLKASHGIGLEKFIERMRS